MASGSSTSTHISGEELNEERLGRQKSRTEMLAWKVVP